MSKDEYAQDIMNRAYYYVKGKGDERNRILKLIDEKIQLMGKVEHEYHVITIVTLLELKEELTKENDNLRM